MGVGWPFASPEETESCTARERTHGVANQDFWGASWGDLRLFALFALPTTELEGRCDVQQTVQQET